MVLQGLLCSTANGELTRWPCALIIASAALRGTDVSRKHGHSADYD